MGKGLVVDLWGEPTEKIFQISDFMAIRILSFFLNLNNENINGEYK
jgi:hypothetical protein